MFFKIQKNAVEPLAFLRAKLNYFIPIAIRNYHLGATELILDSYLKQQYKKSLKASCLEIFKNATVQRTPENDLILILPEAFDKLAQLITYGNGPIQGSPILKKTLRLK